MNEKPLKCPFSREDCSSECALYIDPQELNEVVKNKLASIGVVDRTKGFCSFKNLSLSSMRYIFEINSGYHK